MKKKSKSLKRVDPVKMFSSLRAMSRPEETEKELKTRKESGGFVGPFGFRRKAATMKAVSVLV